MGRGSGGNRSAARRGAGARVSAAPANVGGDVVADLSPAERIERAAILAHGGRLAATMRAAEARTWPPGMLAELWRWLAWLVAVRGYRGATTGTNYARQLAAFAGWLTSSQPGASWETLTLDELEGYLRALYVGRRGKSHRSTACSALKSFYRWRASRGRGVDCTHGLVAPRVDRRAPRKHSRAELRRIFAALADQPNAIKRARDSALLQLLHATGLRREEVASLRVSDLTIDGRICTATVQGKGARERLVSMEGPVVRALLEWIDLRRKLNPEHDGLFVTFHAARPLSHMREYAVERIVKRYGRAAGVRHRGVHVFRVTFATALYDDGVDLERIRVVMGHESIETTRGYLAISDRNRGARLAPHRQHAALGTAPDGLPRWARHLEGMQGGGDD